MQNALSELNSQLTDAKTRLASQEAEIKFANSKLQISLSETENLKTSFAAKKKTWEEEKTLLTQRAEKAETTLKEISTELNGLKGRVSQMVAAIFGKPSDLYLVHFLLIQNISRQLTLFIKYVQAHEARIWAKIMWLNWRQCIP